MVSKILDLIFEGSFKSVFEKSIRFSISFFLSTSSKTVTGSTNISEVLTEADFENPTGKDSGRVAFPSTTGACFTF
jgi:hypothetical protein